MRYPISKDDKIHSKKGRCAAPLVKTIRYTPKRVDAHPISKDDKIHSKKGRCAAPLVKTIRYTPKVVDAHPISKAALPCLEPLYLFK